MRRFGLMLLTLFGISVIIFVMLRVAPGNIADILFDAAGFVDPADKADLQWSRDCGHANSSMRSIARFAFRAISGGTCTRGESVSSEAMMRSSVMVFMNAHTAFGLTG